MTTQGGQVGQRTASRGEGEVMNKRDRIWAVVSVLVGVAALAFIFIDAS